MTLKTVITNGKVNEETISDLKKKGFKLLLSMKYGLINKNALSNDYFNLFSNDSEVN